MGEFSGGGQGVATFYCAAHGVSPITMSVFGRLCRKTITRGGGGGGGETRGLVPRNDALSTGLVHEFCFGFCSTSSPPPPTPLIPFNNLMVLP